MAWERPRWFQVAVAVHLGDAVIGEKPSKPFLASRTMTSAGSKLPSPMKHSVKLGHGAFHVAEMDVGDAALGAKYSIISVTFFLPPVISEQQPRQRSRLQASELLDEIIGLLEIVRLVEEPRHAAQHRHRRIVGMGRASFQALLLGATGSTAFMK